MCHNINYKYFYYLNKVFAFTTKYKLLKLKLKANEELAIKFKSN